MNKQKFLELKGHALSLFPSRRGASLAGLVFVGLAFVGWVPLQASIPRHSVIVVTGHVGDSEFKTPMREAASRWVEASRRAGHSVVWVGEKDSAPEALEESGPLREIKKHLDALEPRSSEPVWLVLIGHGNAQGRTAKFALSGPDLSAEDLSKWLSRLERPVVVIAGFSGSGAFIKPLAGKDRIIVSGTRSGDEENWVRFSTFFAEAITGLAADRDGDGQVSVFEAWLHSAHVVDHFYRDAGRIATEHAVLEDSGDGRAVGKEVFDPPAPAGESKGKKTADPAKVREGALARQWCLVESEFERELSPDDRRKRLDLEARLSALKDLKASRVPEEYQRDLEAVLLELEAVYRAAGERARAGVPGGH